MQRSCSSSTGPRPSRPTESSSSARQRCAASGWPPGSARTASPARAEWGASMAEWIIDGQPGLDTWEMDSRRFGPQYRSRGYCLERTDRGVRHLLRREVPRPRAALGAAPSPATGPRAPIASSARAFGEKGGWERVNWFESNVAAGDEALRPSGWAGRLWSPAVGAEHRACRETRRFVRRDLVLQARGDRPGRGRVLGAHVRQQGRPGTRRRSPTPSCATRPAASSATSR